VDRERFRRIRNYQNRDWYPALVLRPLAVAAMLVIADWRWVTPNRLTLAATVAKIAAAGMILQDDRCLMIWAVVVLQVGAVLDHLDGTMARYRKQTSNLGFFYDATSDTITWFLTLSAVGWVAYQRSSEAAILVVAFAGAYALSVTGYLKSLVDTAEEKAKWRVAAADPDPASVADRIRAQGARTEASEPPERTGRDWAVWFGKTMLQIYRFQEMDLFFWVGLFLLLDRPPELLWLVAITQTLAMIVCFVQRARMMRAIDVPPPRRKAPWTD
jgi:phosphatidylglycerophosphate synthase